MGFAEKNVASSVSDRMIIRIRSISTDYYINFNRQVGMNAGTQEGGNQVLVASRVPGTALAVSYLLAKLGSGGMYTIPQFNGSTKSLKIVVTAINVRTVPARASVSVQFGTPAPTQKPKTMKPITPIPTAKPTPAPTAKRMMMRRKE